MRNGLSNVKPTSFQDQKFSVSYFVPKKSNTLVFVTEVIIEQNAISKSQKNFVQRKMVCFCLKIFVELTKSSAFSKNNSNKVFVSFQNFWINIVGENDLSLSHSFWNIRKSSPSDKKNCWITSTHFDFVSILIFDIETFVLSFPYG